MAAVEIQGALSVVVRAFWHRFSHGDRVPTHQYPLERRAAEVYGFASEPPNLPRWAPGLCTAVERVDGRWIAETGMGAVELSFAPPNPFGVLDHEVALPSGATFHNPMRVLPHDTGCEVVFTLRRQHGMSDADFDRDAAAVLADLDRLKELLERS